MSLQTIATGEFTISGTREAFEANARDAIENFKIRESDSTLVGLNAGLSLSGVRNTLIGFEPGLQASTGSDDVYIGYRTGFNSSGDFNLFLGNHAGADNASSMNVYVGHAAGRYASSAGGLRNVAVGNSAGESLNGANNVFVGHGNTTQPELVPYRNRVCVGADAQAGGHEVTMVGFGNQAPLGHRTIALGTANSASSAGANSVLVGHGIHNSGRGSVIIRASDDVAAYVAGAPPPVFANAREAYLNVADRLIGHASDSQGGAYLTRLRGEHVRLESITGGSSNVEGGYVSVGPEDFLAVAPSNAEVRTVAGGWIRAVYETPRSAAPL